MNNSDQLHILEHSLWIADTRFDQEYMDSILHPEFGEFGRSGRVYTREDTLGYQSSLGETIDIQWPLVGFAVAQIDINTWMVTYVSEVTYNGQIEKANRCSLWVWNNGWQLRFHQGTPV